MTRGLLCCIALGFVPACRGAAPPADAAPDAVTAPADVVPAAQTAPEADARAALPGAAPSEGQASAGRRTPTTPAPAAVRTSSRSVEALLQPGIKLTNAAVRDATGWSAEEARSWLRDQVDAGVLERRGQKRGTWYEVVDA